MDDRLNLVQPVGDKKRILYKKRTRAFPPLTPEVITKRELTTLGVGHSIESLVYIHYRTTTIEHTYYLRLLSTPTDLAQVRITYIDYDRFGCHLRSKRLLPKIVVYCCDNPLVAHLLHRALQYFINLFHIDIPTTRTFYGHGHLQHYVRDLPSLPSCRCPFPNASSPIQAQPNAFAATHDIVRLNFIDGQRFKQPYAQPFCLHLGLRHVPCGMYREPEEREHRITPGICRCHNDARLAPKSGLRIVTPSGILDIGTATENIQVH